MPDTIKQCKHLKTVLSNLRPITRRNIPNIWQRPVTYLKHTVCSVYLCMYVHEQKIKGKINNTEIGTCSLFKVIIMTRRSYFTSKY